MTEVRFTCSRSGCAIWSNCGCKIQLPTRLSAILSWRGPKGWRLHMMPQFPPYWIPPKNSQHAMFSKNGHVIIVWCHVFTDALTSWKHIEYQWRSKLAQSLSPETCKKTRPWASSDSAVTLGPGSCGGRWQFRQRNLPGPAKLLEVLGLQASAYCGRIDSCWATRRLSPANPSNNPSLNAFVVSFAKLQWKCPERSKLDSGPMGLNV